MTENKHGVIDNEEKMGDPEVGVALQEVSNEGDVHSEECKRGADESGRVSQEYAVCENPCEREGSENKEEDIVECCNDNNGENVVCMVDEKDKPEEVVADDDGCVSGGSGGGGIIGGGEQFVRLMLRKTEREDAVRRG